MAAACTLQTSLAQAAWNPADSDSDGLPDEFEQYYFGDLGQTAAADPDGDTLPNSLELSSGRNPMLAETVAGSPDWQAVPGALRYERWNGVSGTTLSGLYSSAVFQQPSPSAAGYYTSAEAPQNQGDNLGLRMRGTLIAPETGDYRFYIAADDQAQLYLGTGAGRFTKRLVCSVNSWTNYRAWTASTSQASAWITLQAGQEYHFEAVMKEGGGGDHLSIGWVRPGQTAVEVVPGKLADGTVVLTSYTPDPADLDDDGLPDAWETAQGLNPGSLADHALLDTDGDGFNNLAEYQTGGSALARGGNTGYCEWHTFWIGSNNLKLSALTSSPLFAQTPGNSGMFTVPEADQNAGTNFGRRIRGVITIPTAGNWRFYIAGDDASALWINPGGVSRFGKTQAAFSSTATSYRAFTAKAIQKSREFSFNAGDKVYFEALYVESGGADHCSVGWTGPGYTSPVVVPSAQISLCGDETRLVNGTPVNNDADNDSLPDDWEVANGLTVTNSGTTARLHGEYGDPDNDGLTNFQEYQNGSNPLTAGGIAGKWTHELYSDIGGDRVVDLIGASGLLRAPDLTRVSESTEHFRNYANNYGQRFRATVTAPVSGSYTFWISGDDGAELWLSTDDRKFAKHRIALIDDLTSTYSYSGYRNWEKAPGQRSVPVTLEATQAYYIEVLHKEAEGDDHVSVAWSFNSPGTLSGYIPTSSAGAPVLFPGMQLADVTSASGTMNGTSIGSTTAASTHFFTNNGSTATFQLQFIGGAYTKAAKVQMTQTQDGVVAWQVYAKYKTGDYLGQNFDSLSGTSNMTIGSGGYGVDGLAVSGPSGPLAGTRAMLPASALTTFARDADDQDDDCLMDSWETAKGLSASDNGLSNSGNGEYGDPDNDSIVNREEWLLGTDPLDPDTDGDGYPDGQEVFFMGTNPLVPELADPVVVGDIAVDGHTDASATWVPTADGGVMSMETRGWIDYQLTVATPGYYLFEIKGRARGSAIQSREDFALDVYVDSRKVASTILTSLGGQQGLAAGFAGWLTEGTHTLRIWNRNLLARRALQLDSLRIVMPSGGSSGPGGLPNWVYDFLSARNTVTSTGLGSFTSPCCVEGTTRDWAATAISAGGSAYLPVGKGVDNRWFADLTLNPAAPTPAVVAFENGLLEQDLEVEWLPFNIAANSHLIVRRNDSLRLTAFTPGGAADASDVSLALNGQSLGTVPANQPLVREFATAGTHTLTAIWTGPGGQVTSTSTIEVLSADFGPAFPVYLNRSRLWSPPSLAEGLPVENDSSLLLTAQSAANGNKAFTVDATRLGSNTVLARTSTQGPVLAAGQVEGVLLSHSSNYELPVIYTYPNGDRIVELSIFATSLPPGGYIRLEIWLGGRLFVPDGTTSKVLTAGDFDQNGVAKVRVLLSSGIGTTCHRTYLHDAAGNLVGQM